MAYVAVASVNNSAAVLYLDVDPVTKIVTAWRVVNNGPGSVIAQASTDKFSVQQSFGPGTFDGTLNRSQQFNFETDETTRYGFSAA